MANASEREFEGMADNYTDNKHIMSGSLHWQEYMTRPSDESNGPKFGFDLDTTFDHRYVPTDPITVAGSDCMLLLTSTGSRTRSWTGRSSGWRHCMVGHRTLACTYQNVFLFFNLHVFKLFH